MIKHKGPEFDIIKSGPEPEWFEKKPSYTNFSPQNLKNLKKHYNSVLKQRPEYNRSVEQEELTLTPDEVY